MATSAPKAVPKAVPKAPAGKSPAVEEVAPIVPKKSRKKLFLALAIGLIVAGGGGGAAWYFTQSSSDIVLGEDGEASGEAPVAVKAGPAKPPVYVVIEPFTVNLQQETGEQFLQVSLTFQVADQTQVDLFKLYMPQVRSRLLLLLSGKKSSEISTTEGKNKLGAEISALMTQSFSPDAPPQVVSNVFFTSFVIQ